MPEISPRPSSITDAVLAHAGSNLAARLRLGDAAEPISYGELWQRVERALARLRALGVGPGDRVALSMSNSEQTVVHLLALMHGGATILPLFHRPRFRPQGKDYARIVAVLHCSRAPWLLTHLEDVPCHQQAVLQAGSETRVEPLEAEPVADALGDRKEPSMRVESEAPALIQFSAGSTADPKGLCLDHEQLVANVHGFAHPGPWYTTERIYTWLPLFHDMGLIGTTLSSLYYGCDLTLRSPRAFIMNPLGWLQEMGKLGSSVTMAPQFAYTMALHKAQLDPTALQDLDLSRLELMINGAEQIDEAVCRAFEDHFAPYGLKPNAIQPAYGLAENCVAATTRQRLQRRMVKHFVRSALAQGRVVERAACSEETVTRCGNGDPIVGTHVRVLDPQGRSLPEGEVGEIAVSGACAARARLLADGALEPLPEALPTGDTGVMVDGELFVLGRVKEMVKRGGEAFSPSDIEQCVGRQLPQLPLVGAFGYYDEGSGSEELVVVAETRPLGEAAAQRELDGAIRRAVLGEFQVPLKDVRLVPPGTLPRTTSGKLRRVVLRDTYLRGELPRPLTARPERAADPV